MNLEKKLVNNFDKIMNFVHNEATKPMPYNESKHRDNKEKFDQLLHEEIENKSQPNPDIGYDELWELCWKKIMYANKKAESAGNEIEAMEDAKLFQDYNSLANSEWNHNPKTWIKIVDDIKRDEKGKKYQKSGNWQYMIVDKEFSDNYEEYFKFVKKINDQFNDKDKIGDVVLRLLTKTHKDFKPVNKNRTFAASNYKIDKYVRIARKFKTLNREEGKEYPLKYFVGDMKHKNLRSIEESHLWEIHKKFESLLGEITALHLMMELGFWVIKPDIVMTKLFHRGGFLSNLNEDQILDKNKYKYTNKTVYKEMINVGRKIADEIEKDLKPKNQFERLAEKNIIRALDLFLVKFGQEPDPKCGITRNLNKELEEENRSFKDFIECIEDEKKVYQLFQQ